MMTGRVTYVGPSALRGLGAAGDILYGSVIDTGLGTKVDCRDWVSYLLNTGCWQLSHDSWNQIGAAYDAATYPSTPIPVAPAAPQTTVQMTQSGAWMPDQAIAATVAAQKQQNLDFFTKVAAGIQASQNPPPDCTQLTTLLTNPSACWNWTYIAIGAGILALVLLMPEEGLAFGGAAVASRSRRR
jgi:hypothetical protein